MGITLQRAKGLCRGDEFEVVLASTLKRVEGLSAARLREKRVLARKLRDKYRGLADKQKRQMRGKESGRAADNKNTLAKAQLFQETLERYEAALAKAESGGTKSASKKKAPVKKKVAKKKATAKKAPVKKKSPAKKSGLTVKALKKKMSSKKPDANASGAALTAPKKNKSSAHSLLFDSPKQRATEKSLIAQSKSSRGARKDRLMQTAWNVKSVRAVAGRTKRNQAKRDAR